ncbi:hypothetical protein QBE53_06205 [Vallitaleaceae bacterium 9-2]
MYFQKLQKLKEEYRIPNDTIQNLDTWLASLRRFERKRFYSDFFAYEYDINPEFALEVFIKASEVGILKINYELHCPECDEFIEKIEPDSIFEESKAFCENGHSFNRVEGIVMSFELIETPKKKEQIVLLN